MKVQWPLILKRTIWVAKNWERKLCKILDIMHAKSCIDCCISCYLYGQLRAYVYQKKEVELLVKLFWRSQGHALYLSCLCRMSIKIPTFEYCKVQFFTKVIQLKITDKNSCTRWALSKNDSRVCHLRTVKQIRSFNLHRVHMWEALIGRFSSHT